MIEAIATPATIAGSTAAINWVYKTQYQTARPPKSLLVGIHFVAVSAIICSYWWVAYGDHSATAAPTAVQALGWAVFALGSVLFWWAAAIHRTSLVPNPELGLTAVGPYRWVRHPIYSGGIVGAAGLLLVTPSSALFVAFSSLVLSMVLLARSEEKEAIARLDGYAAYTERTGAFFPVLQLDYGGRPRNKVAAFLSISRLEFLAAGVLFLLVVAGLGAGSWARVQAQATDIALGCVLWFFCHLLGSQVNCLADVDVDRVYKPRLSAAVDILGVGFVRGAVVVCSAGALAVALWFTVRARSAIPVMLFAVGWALTMAYSLPPLRLKGRWLWAPVTLLLVLYGLPVSFGYVALADSPHPLPIALLGAAGLQMLAVIALNSVEDVPEDRAHGLSTIAVHLGTRNTARLSIGFYLVGALGALVVTWMMLRPGRLSAVVVTAAACGHAWVLATMLRLHRVGDALLDDEPARRRLGRQNALQFAVVGAQLAATALAFLSTP